MRYFSFLILCFTAVLCGACSGCEEKPTAVSLFEATFVETLPGDDTAMEVSHITDEQLQHLCERVDCSVEEIERTVTCEPYVGRRESHYLLSLGATSAKLTTTVRATEITAVHACKGTSYLFSDGRYELYGNSNYTYYAVVYSDRIEIQQYYVQGDMWLEPAFFLALNDYRLYRGKSLEVVDTSERTVELPAETGIFAVITDPNGVAVLQNDSYTYNFIPATGRLTMLEPEYKEIGTLDRK